MNTIIRICWAAAVAVAAVTVSVPAQAQVKTKKVCKNAIDKAGRPLKLRDGSVKQICKTIRIHKKHKGTAIPSSKK